MTELADALVTYLLSYYRSELLRRYQIEEEGQIFTAQEVMAIVCEKRKCYKRGQEPDYEKAAALIVDDFRSGRIGQITLEEPG